MTSLCISLVPPGRPKAGPVACNGGTQLPHNTNGRTLSYYRRFSSQFPNYFSNQKTNDGSHSLLANVHLRTK